MTQVNIKKLDSLTHNDTAATKQINDNFQAVKKALEDSLSRVASEPNYMDTDLDLNTKKIINVASPTDDGDIVNKGYVDSKVGNAREYSIEAKTYADQAKIHSTNAQISAKGCNERAAESREILADIEDIADTINIKNEYTPFATAVTFLQEDWIEEEIEGSSYFTNTYIFSVDHILEKFNIKFISALVTFLRMQALEGSYLSYAQCWRSLNPATAKESVYCKIFKKDSAPDTDIQAFLTIFLGLEEK